MALESVAEDLVREMRVLVPRRSGALAASIGWTWGKAPAGAITIGTVARNQYDRIAITIYAGDERTIVRNRRGVEFQNAWLQEKGTRNMVANPYFFPVYRANRRRIRARLSRAVRRGFQKA